MKTTVRIVDVDFRIKILTLSKEKHQRSTYALNDLQEEVQEVKSRKPPGAVSMFGGIDVAAAVKKRADSLSPEGKVQTTAGKLISVSQPLQRKIINLPTESHCKIF